MTCFLSPYPDSPLARGIIICCFLPIPRLLSRSGYHLLLLPSYTPLSLSLGVSSLSTCFLYPAFSLARGIISCCFLPIPRLLSRSGYHHSPLASHTPLSLSLGVSSPAASFLYPACSLARGIISCCFLPIPRHYTIIRRASFLTRLIWG